VTFGISKELLADKGQNRWVETLRDRLQLAPFVEREHFIHFRGAGSAG